MISRYHLAFTWSGASEAAPFTSPRPPDAMALKANRWQTIPTSTRRHRRRLPSVPLPRAAARSCWCGCRPPRRQGSLGEVTADTVLGAPVPERATEPMDRDRLARDLPA
jgi:hypothetical protein